MNKFLTFLFVIFNSYLVYSNNTVITSNFIGNCESVDTLENYHSINYVYMANDTTNNSSTMTMMSVSNCNSSNIFKNIKWRKHFLPFKEIIHNSDTFSLSTSSITLSKLYNYYDSSNSIDLHLFEIKDITTGNLIAIDYGSNNQNSSGKFLSYLMVCDSSNPYASDYIGANLTFTAIYNYGNTYLFEITDDDRSGMLVGLKYKSPFSTTVYEKYLVPKP